MLTHLHPLRQYFVQHVAVSMEDLFQGVGLKKPFMKLSFQLSPAAREFVGSCQSITSENVHLPLEHLDKQTAIQFTAALSQSMTNRCLTHTRDFYFQFINKISFRYSEYPFTRTVTGKECNPCSHSPVCQQQYAVATAAHVCKVRRLAEVLVVVHEPSDEIDRALDVGIMVASRLGEVKQRIDEHPFHVRLPLSCTDHGIRLFIVTDHADGVQIHTLTGSYSAVRKVQGAEVLEPTDRFTLTTLRAKLRWSHEAERAELISFFDVVKRMDRKAGTYNFQTICMPQTNDRHHLSDMQQAVRHRS